MGRRRWHRTTLAGLGALVVWACTGQAAAQRLPTCVRVEVAGLEDGEHERAREALTALVRSELDRHPSHVHAEPGACESVLLVERIALGDAEYLTGRINWQVPHRVEVNDGDLEGGVEELLRVVLHSDPLRLRGPEEEKGFSAAVRRLKEEAPTLWQIGLLQLVGIENGDVHSIPGLDLRVRREMAQWHLSVRLAVAMRPTFPPDTLTLRLVGNLSAELAWFGSPDAATAGYVAALLGLEYHWFEGPLRDAPNRYDDAHSVGPAVGLRAGVETFRFGRARMDLYTQLSLPLFVSRDEAELVMRRWFPTLSTGVGVAF